MKQFHLPRDRDAYFVIRGYRYQIDLTILRWLRLGDGQHLELECGEDIDIVSTALANPSEELARELEQVKRIERRITLKSEATRGALANAVDHLTRNPGLDLTFRFCTNSTAAVERPSPFPNKTSGIGVWEGIRKGEFQETEVPDLLERIRTILKHCSRPSDFNEEVWSAFKRFVIQADVDKLRWLVDRFEWSLGKLDVEPLQGAVRAALVELGVSPHRQHAADLHSRLFLHLIGLLSQAGRKRLERDEIAELAQMSSLGDHDQALLNLISTEVFRLDARLGDVEMLVERNSLTLASLQIGLQQLGDTTSMGTQVVERLPELSLSPPPLVERICSRTPAVTTLTSGALRRTWTAIHGSVGTGKTQLALLITKRIGTPAIHVSLRDLDEMQSAMRVLVAISRLAGSSTLLLTPDAIGEAIGKLADGSLILVDDIPRLDGQSELSRLLISITQLCSSNHVVLLTTSHHPLPAAIHERLPTGIVDSVAVPPFDDTEALELFELHGGTQTFLHCGLVQAINLFTHGNATLLAAYARSLARRDWELEAAEVSQLKSLDGVDAILQETVHGLLKTVSDADTREILYRLCLVVGQFESKEVQLVASVAPEVTRIRERLAELSGVWLEQTEGASLAVSPLVKPLGASELPATVQTAVNLALAESIVLGRAINVYDAIKAAHYFSESGDANRLGLFLLGALRSSHDLPKRELTLLYLATNADRKLSEEIDLGLRIAVRAQQVIIADRLSRPVAALIADLDDLIEQGTIAEEWAIFLATLTCSWIAGRTELRTGLRFCKRAIELHPKVLTQAAQAREQMGSAGSESTWEPDPAEYVWINLGSVQTASDLQTWIEFLAEFSEEFLTRVFELKSAEPGSLVVVDRPWLTESNKPSGERNWGEITDVLKETKTFSEEQGLELLWAATVRALVVVQAEYLDNFEQGVDIGKHALEHALASSRSRFLINDIIGRQYLYKSRGNDAVPWLEVALQFGGDSYPIIRVRTLLELARALGTDDPLRAVALCRTAVEFAKCHPNDIPDLELAASLSELGLAEWLSSNDAKMAFPPFDEAAHILLSCEDDSAAWKQRFAAFGHAVGYLGSVANRGVPPTRTREGYEYVAPLRGTLMSPNEKLAEYYDEQSYGVLSKGLFPAAMTTFAEGAGHFEDGMSP